MRVYKFRGILLVIILLFQFFSAISFADATAELKTKLTLDEVVDLAQNQSIDIKSLKLDLEALDVDLKNAKSDSEDAEYLSSSANAYETYLLEKYYNVNEIQYNIELKEMEVSDYKNSIAITTTEKYLDILELEKLLLIAKDSLLQAEDLYNTNLRKANLGIITSSDLESSRISLLNSQLDVLRKTNSLSNLNMELCQMIGYPINTVLELEGIDISKDINQYDIINLVADIENNNYEIQKMQIEYRKADEKFTLIDDNKIKTSTFTGGINVEGYNVPSDYITLKNNAENASLDLEKGINDETLNLYIDYYNLKSLEITVQINELNYNAAVRNYNTALVKYDLGMITDYDLSTAKASMDTAYQTYTSSVNDLYIQDLYFQNTIGIYGVDDTEEVSE